MKSILKYVLFGLVVGVVAWAATEKIDRVDSAFPMYFKSGIYIGPSSPNPTGDTRNAIKSTYGDFQSYDFPALEAGNVALKTPCLESISYTKAGLRFGDVCMTGVDQALLSNMQVFPVITAANTYKLVACSLGLTDGGTVNQADSGYTTRCWGNLPR